MEEEKKFKTKTGYCHVLPDKIVLTRDGLAGNISKTVVGDGINRILIIYSALAALLVYQAFDNYQSGEWIKTTINAVLAAWLIYAVIRSRSNSAAPVIERSAIKEVKFIRGIEALTRSRFEVLFTEGGKTKKRLIMLPGSLTGGKEATENALKIMSEEGLLSKS